MTAAANFLDDPLRLTTLEDLGLANATDDPVLNGLVRCASSLTGCPIALVSVVDRDRQWFKARQGVDVPSIPRDQAFCIHTMGQDGLFEVRDTLLDERFRHNPLVTGIPYVRFYAGVPLRVAGHALGALCVIDREPRRLQDVQKAGLQDLARSVMQWLEARQEQLRMRDTQQRLADLIDAAADWAWECDAQWRVTWLSQPRPGRLPTGQFTVGERVPDHLRVDEEGEVVMPTWRLTQALAQADRLRRFVHAVEHGGRTCYVALGWVAVRNAAGDVTGYRGVAKDVTDSVQTSRASRRREQLLSALRLEKLAADQANRAKSEFLSRVSHELRTPLNAIIGFTQLVQNDRTHPLPARSTEHLGRVLQAGRHLLSLINDVMDVTALQQGVRPVNLLPLLIGPLVERCEALIQPQAEQAGVRTTVAQAGRALQVMADDRALSQVLLNLLSNAVKYNRPNGCVDVAVKEAGDQVELSVSDQGAGLSPDRLAQLFQPFNRLGAERGGPEGTGLGLVIAKALVEAMNGTLSVASVPGQGSTFTVALPRARAAIVPIATVAATPAPSCDELGGCEVHDVVYIEDDPVNTLLIEAVVERLPNLTLRCAADGARGLAAIAEKGPDLVLVDINLPDMSGLEIVRRLRAAPETRHMCCVALSADATAQQREAALHAGFDDYWTKPVDLRTLPRLFRELTCPGPSAGPAACDVSLQAVWPVCA